MCPLINKLADLSEQELTKLIIIPLFKALDYDPVEYTHGPDEEGRDIIAWKLSEVNDIELTVAQIKKFKIGRNLASDRSLINILNQLSTAASKSVPRHSSLYKPARIYFITPYDIDTKVLASAFEQAMLLREKNITIIDRKRLTDLCLQKIPHVLTSIIGESDSIQRITVDNLTNETLIAALDGEHVKRADEIFIDIDVCHDDLVEILATRTLEENPIIDSKYTLAEARSILELENRLRTQFGISITRKKTVDIPAELELKTFSETARSKIKSSMCAISKEMMGRAYKEAYTTAEMYINNAICVCSSTNPSDEQEDCKVVALFPEIHQNRFSLAYFQSLSTMLEQSKDIASFQKTVANFHDNFKFRRLEPLYDSLRLRVQLAEHLLKVTALLADFRAAIRKSSSVSPDDDDLNRAIYETFRAVFERTCKTYTFSAKQCSGSIESFLARAITEFIDKVRESSSGFMFDTFSSTVISSHVFQSQGFVELYASCSKTRNAKYSIELRNRLKAFRVDGKTYSNFIEKSITIYLQKVRKNFPDIARSSFAILASHLSLSSHEQYASGDVRTEEVEETKYVEVQEIATKISELCVANVSIEGKSRSFSIKRLQRLRVSILDENRITETIRCVRNMRDRLKRAQEREPMRSFEEIIGYKNAIQRHITSLIFGLEIENKKTLLSYIVDLGRPRKKAPSGENRLFALIKGESDDDFCWDDPRVAQEIQSIQTSLEGALFRPGSPRDQDITRSSLQVTIDMVFDMMPKHFMQIPIDPTGVVSMLQTIAARVTSTLESYKRKRPSVESIRTVLDEIRLLNREFYTFRTVTGMHNLLGVADLDLSRDNVRFISGRRTQLDITQVLQTGKNIFILGEPGSGKTTTLQQYASQVVKEGKKNRIPIFVPLGRAASKHETYCRDMRIDDKDEKRNLENLVSAYIFSQNQNIGDEAIREIISRPGTVLLLDGIDEASKALPWIQQSIKRFIDSHDHVQVVATSRFGMSRKDEGRFSYVKLLPFTRKQLRQFIEKWFSNGKYSTEFSSRVVRSLCDHLDSCIEVADICRTPLLATTLCVLAENGIVLPNSEVLLYEERMRLLLGDYDLQKGISRGFRSTRWNLGHFCRRLAYTMHCESIRELEVEDIYDVSISCFENRLSMKESKEVVDDLIERCYVLVPMNGIKSYGFGHLRYQEYLVATELSRDRSISIVDLLNQAWWRGALVLFSECVRDIRFLFRDYQEESMDEDSIATLRAMIQRQPESMQAMLNSYLGEIVLLQRKELEDEEELDDEEVW